jgi:hypothetical protein
MRLLRLAVETQRWDLAAHTIILADVRQVRECSILVLRGLSIYLDANPIPGVHSFLAKASIDNALAEMERWRLE